MDEPEDFDFEYWADLAENDPEEFERQRKMIIDEIISSCPKESLKRMQGIQWQIDQIRDTSKNPMSACIKISQMMWDTVLGDNGLIDAIENLNRPGENPDSQNQDATILNFPNDEQK